MSFHFFWFERTQILTWSLFWRHCFLFLFNLSYSILYILCFDIWLLTALKPHASLFSFCPTSGLLMRKSGLLLPPLILARDSSHTSSFHIQEPSHEFYSLIIANKQKKKLHSKLNSAIHQKNHTSWLKKRFTLKMQGWVNI